MPHLGSWKNVHTPHYATFNESEQKEYDVSTVIHSLFIFSIKKILMSFYLIVHPPQFDNQCSN